MSVEEKAASIISKVGLWWPLAEEDQLRRAARAYEQVGLAVLAAATTGAGGAALVTSGSRGDAIDAFSRHWRQYADAGLPATARAAANVSAALTRFAAEVESAKRKIINLSLEIGASLAVGIGLAIFTFGTSVGAAAARTAMLVARGLTVAMGLSGVVSTIVATVLTGAAFGTVEGFISGIVAQAATTALSDGDGIALGRTMDWTAGGLLGGAAFTGGGLAVRSAYRTLRHGDSLIANRLRGIRWGDETGSIGAGLGDGEGDRLAAAANRAIDADKITMYNRKVPITWRDDPDWLNKPLFRNDTRTPDEIWRSGGFHPTKPTNLDIDSHLGGSPSAFVSAAPGNHGYGMRGDALYHQYEIRAPGGIDVHRTDPYSPPGSGFGELLFPGGIDSRFIVGARPWVDGVAEAAHGPAPIKTPGALIRNPHFDPTPK